MAWPLSQDYNEAVQTPLQSFSDAELKQAEAKCNAIGIPMPCSGNFADVYEMTGPGGKKWAVKCFTRQVPGLRERYAAISAYLKQVNLPFMVDFAYLEQGVRIKGQWYPILKMDWVEGFVLNQLVKEHADNPPVLELLAQIWLRLAQRLREAKMAHADLQHGNVLLVPGSQARSLAVRLIDYDGMFVPALARTRSGEVGHPAYQHPLRLRDGTYNAEVDRFPHLVIYTALRSLMVGGRYLWKKYDNGDNLLFRQADLNEPGKSALFAELMKLGDAELRKLVQTLAQSVQKPLEQTPLVEELAGGVAKRKSAVVPATVDATPGAIFAQAAAGDVIRRPRPSRRSYTGLVVAGVVAVVALAVGAVLLATHRTPRDTGPEALVAAKNGPLDKKGPDSKKADLKGAPKVEPPVDVKLPPRIDPKVGPKTDPKEEPKIDPKPAPPPEVGPAPLSLQGHSGWVRSVAFSPDGKHIVSGSSDNTLKVWNAQTGQEERTLAGHTNAVWSVAYSPDGKRIISGSNDKTLKVWDAQSGKQLLSLTGNTAPLVCVAFSPDGKRIVSGSTDNTLKVWNAQTGQVEHTLAAHGNRVASVAFSSDGQHIISGSADLTIKMWNAQTGQAERTFKGHTNQVRSVAFSPDGKQIVSGSADSTLKVWNAETGQAERTLQGHTSEVHSVAFSPDGKHIVSGSQDKTVKVWDAQTGHVERTLAGHTERVGSVAFSPDGRRIVSGSNDQTVKVWTLPDAFAVQPGQLITDSIGMKLARVPAGTFWMGGGGGTLGERQVTIPHAFYLGIYPVTQQQWQAVMGSNPSHFSRAGKGQDKVKGIADADLKQFPVETVSWKGAQQFIQKLNAREKSKGLVYRLPTEVEWEYACRGAPTSKDACAFDFYFDRPTNDLSSSQANFDGNHPAGDAPKGQYLQRPTKVGSYHPNRLGLYDMHGNVWQWCDDAQGSGRVIRGGAWDDPGSACRAANRYGYAPSDRGRRVGFRLARVPSGSKEPAPKDQAK